MPNKKTAPANFDFVARYYKLIENGVFWGKLQQTRTAHLEAIGKGLSPASRVLVVGDGDGRFLETLTANSASFHCDYVDASQAMMKLAKKRLQQHQVEWFCGNILDFKGHGYDLIVTHFFLDCFVDPQLKEVVDQLFTKLKPGGIWLISDFSTRPGWWARTWIFIMYAFFRCFTSLRTGSLQCPEPHLESLGLKRGSRFECWSGFLYSQIWKKERGGKGHDSVAEE